MDYKWTRTGLNLEWNPHWMLARTDLKLDQDWTKCGLEMDWNRNKTGRKIGLKIDKDLMETWIETGLDIAWKWTETMINPK